MMHKIFVLQYVYFVASTCFEHVLETCRGYEINLCKTKILTDVSGQPIGAISIPDDGADRLSLNVGNKLQLLAA